MKISPELVPHADFHKGAWLLPEGRTDWYYFLKKKTAREIKNKDFINSVDGPLQPLVKYLHKKGIKTTPSCAGHHFGERNIEMTYDDLERDKEAIVNGGIRLKDIETGKLYLYQDKNYSLPWNREEFIKQLTIYQQKGVIGIRLGNHKTMIKELLKITVKGAIIKKKGNIVFIFVDGEGGNNGRIWKRVTKEVKNIIK